MSVKTLLITPPFTQLNTPYPATAYLKGFLDSKDVDAVQYDLSIALFNKVFTSDFIARVFQEAEEFEGFEFPLVRKQKAQYIERVDVVTHFLRNQDAQKAQQILVEGFLPKAHRGNLELDAAYHDLDEIDKAKHLGTLFIEELGDFITANVDEFFSFTRYAEQIATSASSFDQLAKYLSYSTTLIEDQLLLLLVNIIEEEQPDLICFTIPFPGNLFSALRCGQFIKKNYRHIKVAFGGGYCNTELRSLTDPRIFKYIDYISLDDGEGPLYLVTQFLDKKISEDKLERVFLLKKGKVVYQNKTPNTIFHHKDLPAPSYKGLDFKSYMSFLDVINPMHRLWTDGRWNKLTISHGCYWKQCSFCDVNLDYIGNYQNTTAVNFVDKIEQVMSETGINGFHFVDEAAPPKMLKAIADELLARKLTITWWTNIRFEKTFNDGLCELLSKSGCIAVTGGLEVASDRLLTKMKKGVDIAQVARVTNSFSKYGVMVHAYLMYGFPTETEQETIDSLEVVRQLFENNCIQSAFWHQFTTTVHSPIGKNPSEFDIKITGPKFKGFAQNDLTHKDPTGAKHQNYTKGLNRALNSYLNSTGFDVEIGEWFGFDTAPTTLPKNLINGCLA
ncbi:MAG: radical SAM protein [Flavobacteriales bacterium]|nr:MAG: radical SAM protein [Flavobacteriales bacterium]